MTSDPWYPKAYGLYSSFSSSVTWTASLFALSLMGDCWTRTLRWVWRTGAAGRGSWGAEEEVNWVVREREEEEEEEEAGAGREAEEENL